MKTKILFTALACFSLLFGSCKKEKKEDACSDGTLFFKNTQVDPYKVYIDGTLRGTLAAGNTSAGFALSPNLSHTLKAEQASGYVLYPTIITGSATMGCAASTTWSF